MTPSPVAPAACAAGPADRIDAVLPQTQCRRCGYADCRAYADAIADDGAPIDRCPPGGADGIRRLAAVTGRAVVPLDPAVGAEGPLKLAVIDEAWCIGCTLCLAACPVDAIVGAPKRMHTVVAERCTGCELCLPACPVDCIAMADPPDAPATGTRPTGRAAWSDAQADAARARYAFRRLRLEGTPAPAATVPAPRPVPIDDEPAGDAAGPPAGGTDTDTAGDTGTPVPAFVPASAGDAARRALLDGLLARARERARSG